MFPVVTQELADQIEKFELEAHLSKVSGMQRAPGNPLGVEIARFGRAAAFTIRGAPRIEMYRALNLNSPDIVRLSPFCSGFAAAACAARLISLPHHSSDDLLIHMADLGMAQTGFLTILYGIPAVPENPMPPGVTIQEYSQGSLDEFAALAVEIETNGKIGTRKMETCDPV